MRVPKLMPVLLLISCIWGCGTTQTFERSVFTFYHNGNNYKIVSMSLPDKAGHNFLELHDSDGEFILQAEDRNSNGRLDVIIIGDYPLERANEIYSIGIQEALNRGQFEARTDLRIYELILPEGVFSIKTIGYDDSKLPRRMVYGRLEDPVIVYNEFSVLISNGQNITFTDIGPNGQLNLNQRNRNLIEDPQRLYRMVLDAGIEEGSILRIADQYVVESMMSRSPS